MKLPPATHHHNYLARGWSCRINPDGLPAWVPPRWLDPAQTPMVNHRILAAHAARRHVAIRRPHAARRDSAAQPVMA